MKNFKLSKIVQMILIILLVCIVAGIIVRIITNNNSLAGAVSKCTDCNIGTLTTSYKNNYNGTHSRIATCSNCGATSDGGTVNCAFVNPTYYNNNDGTHTKKSKCVCGGIINENQTCSGTTVPKSNENGTHTLITKCTSCGSENEGTAVSCEWEDATCTEPKKCSVCGYETGEALGHNYSYYPVEEGKHRRVCSECKIETTVDCEWKAATCTEPETCVCGQTRGSALEHDYQPATAGKHRCSMCKDIRECVMEEATCTEPKKCMVCEYEAGEALGHNYSYYPVAEGKHRRSCSRCKIETTVDCEWKEATCTEPETCVCGQTRGSALEHDYKPATAGKHRCSVCGLTEDCVWENYTCIECEQEMYCLHEKTYVSGDYSLIRK